jgi:hypothetical protein
MDAGIQLAPLTDPKPWGWVGPMEEDLSTRRKPRRYATVDVGKCEPCPWPLDFCMWLGSELFFSNRRHILQMTGATWIGDDPVPTNGTLAQGLETWLKSVSGLSEVAHN